jgi:hypothetical protein
MVYYNRYNDPIEFIDNGDTVTMRGGKWMRYGFDTDPSVLTMVDPSGGPYIDIGYDLIGIFRDGISRRVTAISVPKFEDRDGDVLLTINRMHAN